MRRNGKRGNDESKESSTNEVFAEHINMTAMQGFEIYLPTTLNDGTPVEAAKIQGIKDTMVKAVGGYTHLNHRLEGPWRMGGVTFHDEVTIVRVLDDGSAHFDMTAFKKSIETALQQEAVLIISRQVAAV
jgi:hypothetical protein